ncbi:uncharacterized protein LOC115923774 [Strongylocentrotus purpuratus]|uniref:Uncharacterized protein n=1 Tax=Strongylocentrotus purpuratus TaxID=7668 RepID=A0A7M7NXY7_STRPU|nr:uncharacterized protein LOC115923774 [Strongylocentrotus purpuratus]
MHLDFPNLYKTLFYSSLGKQSVKMNFPVIFIFIAFAMCNVCKSEDEWKTVIEGASVHLHYPYPCNSIRVKLQYGYRAPFYTLADTESIVLPPAQVNRFTFRNKSESDHCSLQVSINHVKRIDAGTYIFFAYSEDGIYESSFKRIGLNVDFLPGKASCTMGKENTVGNWVALDCMAPVGTLSGQIDCFQSGEKMPPITEPTETHTHLKQTILVKKKDPVFCCTSTSEHTKDLCDCNDCQLDLANDLNLNSVIDPCGLTTLSQDQTKTSDIAFTPSKPVSTTATTIKINSNSSVPWKYVVYGLGSILTLAGFVIILIVLMLRSRKKKLIYLRAKLFETKLNPRVHKDTYQRSITI